MLEISDFLVSSCELKLPKGCSRVSVLSNGIYLTCGIVCNKEKIHLSEIIPGPLETCPERKVLREISFSINLRNCHHVEGKNVHGQIGLKDRNS